MKKIETEEVHKLLLDILIDTVDFCNKNEIQYFLGYGTLLGAVRHKGFIPWDDDIDLIMMRGDYDKFISLYKENRYNMVSFRNKKDCIHTMIKIYDNSTLIYLQNSAVNNYELGVYIDIFPIDTIPNNFFFREWQYFCIQIYKKLLGAKVILSKNILVRLIKLVLNKTILHFIDIFTIQRGIFKNAIKYNNSIISMSHVACLVADYGRRERMSKELFSNSVNVEFEGMVFKAPVGYREYLASIYGEYMKQPALKKQVFKHSYTAYVKK